MGRAEEESERQQREIGQLQRRNFMISVLALVALIGLILTMVMVRRAESFRVTAETARAEAQSRQLALIAEELRPADRNVAAQLSLAAYRTAHTLEGAAAVLKSAGTEAPFRVLGAPGTVRIVASPEGELLLRASSDGVVDGWRREVRPEPSFTFRASTGQLFALAHGEHAGRQLVAVGGQGTASLWDVTGEPEQLAEFGAGKVAYSVAFAAGQAFLGLADGTIVRVDLDTLTALPSLQTHAGGPVEGLAVSPDGSVIVAAGADGLVAWHADGTDRDPLVTERRVARAQFSPDGRSLALGGGGGMAMLLDVAPDGTLTPRLHLKHGAVAIHSLHYDGERLFLGAWDGQVGAFSLAGEELGAFQTSSTVTALAMLKGRVVTGTIDGVLQVWPARYSGMLVEGSANALPIALTQDHVVKYFDGYAGIYHLDGSPEHRLKFTEDIGTGYGAVLISSHVVSLPTASGRLAVWDAEAADPGEAVFSQIAASGAYELIGGPDSLAVFAEMAQESVSVIKRTGLHWEVVAQVPTWSTLAMGWHPTKPWLAAMSVDSERLVIHDLTSGAPQVLGEVEVPKNGAAVRLEWSPDGDEIYVGTDSGLIFQVEVGPRGIPTLGPTSGRISAGVASIDISEDGTEVAVGLLDGRIDIWRVEDDTFVTQAMLRPGRGSVSGIQLQGQRLIFVTDTGGVYSWPLNIDAAFTELCAAVGEPLTAEEWERLVPGMAPMEVCAS